MEVVEEEEEVDEVGLDKFRWNGGGGGWVKKRLS